MPISSSDDGSETELSELQSAKASCPICFTVDGSATDFMLVFPAKAPAPIAVTLSEPMLDGMLTEVSLPVYSVITPPDVP